MRTGFFLSAGFGISCLVAGTYAIQDAKVLRIPFEKHKRHVGWEASPDASRLRSVRKRASKTVLQILDNEDYLFYANISLGTPPQPLRLHIDTGSSDVWVESSSSSLCQQFDQPCETGGTYDNTSSSTYEFVNSDFSIQYVDQEYARGDYGKETLTIGPAVVKGLQFGYGLEATSDQGIMGIGFKTNEAQTGDDVDPYDNLPILMQKQGFINSVAYSLWLNDLDALEGEILFGGIDAAKYQGNLTTLPIDKRVGQTDASEFIITLLGVNLTNGGGDTMSILDTKTTGLAVLLDTGASFTYLPSQVANDLANEIGAAYSQSFGGQILPCSRKEVPGSIDFIFSGITIKVSLDEFIIDATTDDGQVYVDPSTGEAICFFGILGTDDSDSSTLGDTFLRSAYVVYDLSNQEISLAQTIYNTTASDVIEIKSGKDGVPRAEGASSALTIAATATGAAGGVTSAVSVSSRAATTTTVSSGTTTATPTVSKVTTASGSVATVTATSTGFAMPGSSIDRNAGLLGAVIGVAALFI